MNLVTPNPVAMDKDGVKYNYLVESATPNEDSTEWTIVLKEGLKWNDGEPVLAEDLIFTASYGLEHKIGFFDSYFAAMDLEKSEAVDERTAIFRLTTPNVNFWNGAGFWIPIMRKSEWEKVDDPENYDYSGAGYGPYFVSEWVDGEYVTLERNPHFTIENDGKGALLDQVVFRVYTDENALILALKNGEIDAISNFVSPASQTQLDDNPDLVKMTVPSLGYSLLTFSQTNELLTDVNVRQAIARCVDRDALVAVAWSGQATPMKTPISPVYTEFTKENIEQPAFDVEEAKKILEDAGYQDTDGDGIRESKDGKKLSFVVSYKSTLPNVEEIMTIIKSSAEEAGIELVQQPLDAATFSANVTQGHKYDISYSSWGTIDDVDTTLLTCFGIGQTLNFMEFNDQKQEDLLLAMQGETSLEKRIDLLNQWQTWFVENLPTLHLVVQNNSYYANQTKFGGWDLSYGNSGFMACPTFVKVFQK